MQATPPIAFATEAEHPELEIRVNFGMFAGREATAAELDELARDLLPEIGEVSIVSEQRLEIGEDSEAALHQVRIDVASEHVPGSISDRHELTTRLVVVADRWARACIADRHVEVAEL